MKTLFSRYKYPFFLLLISFVAYFGVFIYAPIYDFADEFFPGRYFMLEAINQGIFPIWIPYQSMGLPTHADPQAGIFYLPLWLLSLFGSYTPLSWGIEYLFHAFLGGCGFYFLTRYFVKNRSAAFLVAACYMLSGFYTGNAQHISWIISATWIPWLIRSVIELLETPSFKMALKTAFFASLLFTGGYPGFSFILFFFFIVLFIYYCIVNIRARAWGYFAKLFPFLLVAGVVCLLLVAPGLFSLIEAKSLITRGDSLPYEKTITVPFTLQSLISLLFPYVASSEPSFIKTDISMGNIFIGSVTLFFVIIGTLQKKSGIFRLLCYWGVLCFFISLGDFTPIHRWAYHLLPFVRMIRIPAIFRIFVIITLLLLASLGFEKMLGNPDRYRKPLCWFSCVLLLLSGLFAVGLLLSQEGLLSALHSFNIDHLRPLTITHKLIFESLFLSGLLLIIAIAFSFKWRLSIPLLIIVLFIDLFCHTWVDCRKTVYMTDFTNKQFSEILNREPDGYPIPGKVTSSLELYHERYFGNFWRNLGIYAKEIEWDSYKGVILKEHEKMLRPYHASDSALSLPVIMLTPSEVIYSESPRFFSMDTAYTADPEMLFSCPAYPPPEVEILSFKPGEIWIKSRSNRERPLMICQNNYPGWRAETKAGVSLNLFSLNYSLISVNLPEGEETIRLYYARPDILLAFIMQLSAYLGLLIYSLVLKIKKLNEKREDGNSSHSN